MRPTATDVNQLALCVGHMGELCKTADPIEMPFGWADSCGSKEPCIRWGTDLPRGTIEGEMYWPIVTYVL